jgi:uncharacterized protein (TIGR02594 family)
MEGENMSEPKWLELARTELGQHEISGPKSNPDIIKFFNDAGHPEVHSDATAWCAAFAGAMLKRAGYNPSGSLMARSYLKWGTGLQKPEIGSIAVLWRNSPDSSEGHVGFVVDAGQDFIKLLGGNQGSLGQVSIETFPMSRVLGFRWPYAESLTPLQEAKLSFVQGKPAYVVPTEAQSSNKRTGYMNPLSFLTTFVTAVLPPSAPGTPSAGIVTPIGAAGSSLISIVVGAVLAGLGGSGFGADAMHTVSAVAGVLLVVLSGANHLGLIKANNANTEAYAEALLKQIADAGKSPTA